MSDDVKRSDDIVRKIKHLLRKADPSANTSEAEMQSAMAMAQKLALKYQLDLASIDPHGEEFTVNESTFYQNVRINNEVKHAITVVCEFFNVSVYYWHHRKSNFFHGVNKSQHEVKVVGTDADKAVAQYIFNYLIVTFRSLWNEARKSGRYPTKFPAAYEARHSFMLGLVNGVTHRLREEKAAQCQERALMVISNKLVERNKWMEEKHPDLGEAKRTHIAGFNQEAFDDGVKQGRAISVRPGIANGTPNKKPRKGALA